MVMRPAPMLFKCPQCGWQELHDSPSDVMLRPHPECCEDCGCHDLDIETLDGQMVLLKQINQFIQSYLSSKS